MATETWFKAFILNILFHSPPPARKQRRTGLKVSGPFSLNSLHGVSGKSFAFFPWDIRNPISCCDRGKIRRKKNDEKRSAPPISKSTWTCLATQACRGNCGRHAQPETKRPPPCRYKDATFPRWNDGNTNSGMRPIAWSINALQDCPASASVIPHSSAEAAEAGWITLEVPSFAFRMIGNHDNPSSAHETPTLRLSGLSSSYGHRNCSSHCKATI